jgi:hypothetical protein
MVTVYDKVTRKCVCFMGWRDGKLGLKITQGHGKAALTLPVTFSHEVV